MFRLLCLVVCWSLVSSRSYRLPTSVIPSHYKLQILSNLGEPENFNFQGKVWIQVTCTEPTRNVTLHSKDLNITDDVTVKKLHTSEHVKVTNFELNNVDEFLIIHLDEELRADQKYEVAVSFEGYMGDALNGFYRSSYVDEKTKEKKWLGVTQFEATSARKAFPCFDEPAMKATFEIVLGHKKGYSSISNMPLLQTTAIEGKEGWFWDKYEPSVPMSTYLVAFIVSDLGLKQSDQSARNNVTFKIWARKDALDQVDFAKEVGPKALEYYEEFFGIAYPLPKQDMVAVPDFSAGAMENWGLITYRETALLFDPKISAFTNKHRIANVIAHELAHQWFGNLVTMRWWTDLWLNEGFATYMAGRAVDHLFPKWKSLDEEAVSSFLGVLSFDALRTSHPVSVPIGDPNEISQIFDTISYKKGSFLIRMMSLFLGDETLRKGVSNYLRKHKYGNAEQDDLWAALTEEGHTNGVLPRNLSVKTVMDTWTLQTGYPLVTVVRNYKSNTAELRQRRFIKDEIRTKSDGGTWWIPLSYTDGKELAFKSGKPKSWFAPEDSSETVANLPDANTWVIFNIQVSGLYRVNYDEHNWKLLSHALNGPDYQQIPVLNRVQLVDDAFDLAWTGNLKYEVLFNLLRYIKVEREFLPWKSALSNVLILNKQLKKTSVYGDFKNYMKTLLSPIYQHLGGLHYTESANKSLDAVKHQFMVASISCRLDMPTCVTDAQELFKKYQKNPLDKNLISKELRSVIYCTAVRYGGEQEWELLWKEYKKSNVASEKRTLLEALGCTSRVWLLRRYLEWSITAGSDVRKQDSSSVFEYVANNDIGFYVAKEFLYTRIQDIRKYLEENPRRIASYLSSIASQITNEEEYRELQNFIKNSEKYLKDIKQGVDQSAETAKVNVQWHRKYLNEVKKLLKEHSEESVD